MPETIVIEEIITRLYHDLEKYGVRFRNIFRVCSLSFVYENINWVKWAHLCTRTCKSSWHGTSRAQFMRGFIYLHNISLFTYNLKNVAPNNKKVNLNSSICDRSLFFFTKTTKPFQGLSGNSTQLEVFATYLEGENVM